MIVPDRAHIFLLLRKETRFSGRRRAEVETKRESRKEGEKIGGERGIIKIFNFGNETRRISEILWYTGLIPVEGSPPPRPLVKICLS